MSRTFLNGITDPRSPGVGKVYTSDASGNGAWATSAAASAAKLNNIWYDVIVDWGFVGDDATDNLSHWNTMISTIPNNSVVYFPPGTYRFSAEATINVDKHLQFKGAGAQVSVLKTTSTTANLVNITGAAANAWYNTFADLGFQSSVTKTAGAHLGINVATAIGIDIRRCAFTGHFIGIDAQGAQAGNVSVWDSITIGSPAVNGRGIRINGNTINVVISNTTINGVPNAGAIAGSANIEINQSGAVQIYGCDLIGAVNSLLLNANQGGTTSIAAIYCNNTFFDQSGGSTIKVTGANITNRIKFSQCGVAAGIIGSPAIEIAGTGTGTIGGATAAPAGISIMECDIYYAPGASTSAGILITGAQDVLIQNNRITGFSGTGGAGINCTSTSPLGATSVQILGNRIGPNGNFTPGNTVGIQITAGAAAYGGYSICDNDLRGSVTPIVDSGGLAISGGNKNIARNLGTSDGTRAGAGWPGQSGIIAAVGSTFTTTEVIMAQVWAPPNTLKVGTLIRAQLITGISATGTTTCKIRIGTVGSATGDASLVIVGPSTASGAAAAVKVDILDCVNVIGATATHIGSGSVVAGATGFAGPVPVAASTFNSTVGNWVTFTALCSAGTSTVRAALLEIISPT